MNSDMASRGWDIRPLTEGDIEAYLDIYLNSYPAYKALDAECRAHYRASTSPSCGRTPRPARWAFSRTAR